MPTISTTLKLIDQMSEKLIAITSAASGLSSEFDAMKAEINSAEERMNKFSYEGFAKSMGAVGETLTGIGDKMTAVFTLPGVLLGKKMYGAATDYETALAGVQKTTGATGDDLEMLNQKLLDIAENMPIAGGYVQAAATMQMGANFGIHDTAQLDKFTRTYEKLVTATDIQGESGAEEIAQFLNIVEGGAQNADRFGSVIVDLGNNFATTESAILSMATRMAATAELTDFATPDILAFAAALTSVGIDAEAGGSAAGKLMKSMQGAAEVGAQAMNLFGGEYANATAFGYFISDKNNLLNVAGQLGVTTDYINSMYDAWLNLENYADISGKTADQFAKDWANNPAQNMLDFFDGLGALDASGQESAIAAMERMGITEIRMSNMVAAMAGKSDLLRNALEMALAAYAENTALDREYDIFASTQESQNQMLANKAQNAMADFGENIVQAIQPALDMANGLLDAFNGMTEVDQDKIVKIMGALIVAGPVAAATGRAATAVSKIATAAGKIAQAAGAENIFDSIKNLLSLPLVKEAAILTAITALSDFMNSTLVPNNANKIIENLANIQVSINQESYDATMAAIAEMQAATDLLAGGAITQEAIDAGSAVRIGVGTASMFGTALAYEAALMEENASRIAGEYGALIAEQEAQIRTFAAAGDMAAAEAAKATYNALLAANEDAQAAAQAQYSQSISELFDGMVTQYIGAGTEAAKAIEAASANYDLIAAIAAYGSFSSDEAGYGPAAAAVVEQAFGLGYLDDLGYGFRSAEEAMAALANDSMLADEVAFMVADNALAAIESAMEVIGADSRIGALIASIIDNPAIMDSLDMTQISGLFSGVVRALDASDIATDDWSQWGQHITQGLAGATLAESAALSAAGYSIGADFSTGAAQGIMDYMSRVTAAARAVGNAAAAAMRVELDEHSPSRVARKIGAYFGEGFEIGILDSVKSVSDAAGSLAGTAWDELKMSDGDAKRLRSLAERETINHFTTAELHIDFTANNNINSNMDLDGVVTYLEDQLTERLQMAAEGVYS